MNQTSKILPIEALPNMIKVMRQFNLALKDEIEQAQDETNFTELQKIIHHLSDDLITFTESFNFWKTQTYPEVDETHLAELGRQFDHAKELLSSALKIAHPMH